MNPSEQINLAIIGFDSAWTDSPKNPGAICAIEFGPDGSSSFTRPLLVSFDGALEFIEQRRQRGLMCLIALDQPTIVQNETGMRPVERVAASLVSYVGGGVQPANRSKRGLFCPDAPLWRFLSSLRATENPERARTAESGVFIIEVFPALALPALAPEFAQRLRAPKYNPANRRMFRRADWDAVAHAVSDLADRLGISELALWASKQREIASPRKADQDMLDASLCALIGLIWRACQRDVSAMIGDVASGYMITPVSDETRARLAAASLRHAVPLA
jgi:predicted RNase H-like nuclease